MRCTSDCADYSHILSARNAKKWIEREFDSITMRNEKSLWMISTYTIVLWTSSQRDLGLLVSTYQTPHVSCVRNRPEDMALMARPRDRRQNLTSRGTDASDTMGASRSPSSNARDRRQWHLTGAPVECATGWAGDQKSPAPMRPKTMS